MPSKTADLLRNLAREGSVEAPVIGACMAPLVVEGQRIALRSARFYWPGDLVAFRAPSGRLLLHRLLGYRPSRRGLLLVTQADNAPHPDSPVPASAVIGRLTEREGVPFVAPLRDRLAAYTRFTSLAWKALGRRLRFGGTT